MTKKDVIARLLIRMDLGVSSMEVEVKQSGSGSSSGNKQKQLCPPSYDESIDAPDCQLEVQSSGTNV